MAISSIQRRKGFKYFLDVAEKVPNFYKFVWIGKRDTLNEKYTQRIKSINNKSGYEKIEILDFTPNPYSLLNKSHIFFLPSLDEPFGIVYLEAFALGKFVICPINSGFSELIIKNKKLGYVYNSINQVINLLKSEDINYYIYNHNEERINLAKNFDIKFYFENFYKLINKYNIYSIK